MHSVAAAIPSRYRGATGRASVSEDVTTAVTGSEIDPLAAPQLVFRRC